MIKANLEEVTRLLSKSLSNFFSRATGVPIEENIFGYDEKRKVGHYPWSNIEYEFCLKENGYGQAEFLLFAEPYEGEKIVREGEIKHSQGEVNESHYIAKREITENGTKIILKCRIKRFPEVLDKVNPLFADLFEFMFREGIRVARVKPISDST